MFIYLNKKAQSTAEYVIVFSLVIGAAVAMTKFVQRNLQEKQRLAAEYVDPEGVAVFGARIGQYDPYYQGSNLDRVSRSNEREEIDTAGGDITRNVTEDFSNTSGTQTTHAAPITP